MPKPKDWSPLPDHPAVLPEIFAGRYKGRAMLMGRVRCPSCLVVRERSASEIRREARRANFQGYCRPCSFLAIREGRHTKILAEAPAPRLHNGYRLVRSRQLPLADLPMFRAMMNQSFSVLEHRWVVAKHLGRPLLPTELVDHMDGDKTNNAVENLRIYIRGANQPGSTNAAGTYYHEWQMALAEVRQLREELARITHRA